MGTIQRSVTPIGALSITPSTSKFNNLDNDDNQAIDYLDKIKELITQMEEFLKEDSAPNVKVLLKEIGNYIELLDSIGGGRAFNPKVAKDINQVLNYYYGVIVPYTNNYEEHPNNPDNSEQLLAYLKDFDGFVEGNIYTIKANP